MKSTVLFAVLAALSTSTAFAAADNTVTRALEQGQSLSSAQQQSATQPTAQNNARKPAKPSQERLDKEAAKHQRLMNQGKDHTEAAR